MKGKLEIGLLLYAVISEPDRVSGRTGMRRPKGSSRSTSAIVKIPLASMVDMSRIQKALAPDLTYCVFTLLSVIQSIMGHRK